MTLYLLFEQLDKGAMTLHTRIPISEHAAAQEPSKLGIRPGETISVEDAIKAVVTRSANDIAVAIAEAIGADESTFAEMMTHKAHELGMSNTLYRNASGLPNDEQLTTAHDLSILGRAMEERFPRYFNYFSTAEFDYAGQVIGNHDHLLGRVDGVDGIKTGYTRASGFNLLTSVHRDGRSLIAVVMGGRSAAWRDRIMAEPDRRPSSPRPRPFAPRPRSPRPRPTEAAGRARAQAAPGGAPRLSASRNEIPSAHARGEGDKATEDDDTAASSRPRPRRPRPPRSPARSGALERPASPRRRRRSPPTGRPAGERAGQPPKGRKAPSSTAVASHCRSPQRRPASRALSPPRRRARARIAAATARRRPEAG